MAKAQFHRNQKVWVESVGAWAIIEKIVPIWAKGFDEPVKITYDVGLGREFVSTELKAEDATEELTFEPEGGVWRILRARNKWQAPEDCSHHPFPGTFPVVVTDRRDWGGWRTPGSEYDRDPAKLERQARLIASAPALLKLAADLHAFVGEDPENAPAEIVAMAKKAIAIMRKVSEQPTRPEPKFDETEVLAAE
jgi:hypothetical protein